MTSPNKKIVTKNDHNELANHWSDVVRLGLNPVDSDNTYKHHVARLMRVYTNHKTSIDHATPMPAGKKMIPLSQLYGVHGIISSKVKDEKLRKREKQWQSRLVTTENLEHSRKKEFRESRKGHEVITSQDTLPKYSSSSPNLSSTPHHQSNQPQSSQQLPSQFSQAIKYRVDDPEMTETELLANGVYSLSPEQLKTFQDFTELLSTFDNYDMVRILEDAYRDAKRQTGLDDYGGTSLP